MIRLQFRSRGLIGGVLSGLLTLMAVAASFAEDLSIADLPEEQLREILPGAETFQQVTNQSYWEGRDAGGEIVGWVALSTDVVSIKGYSGRPW